MRNDKLGASFSSWTFQISNDDFYQKKKKIPMMKEIDVDKAVHLNF